MLFWKNFGKFLQGRVLGDYFQEPKEFSCSRRGCCCENLPKAKLRRDFWDARRGPFYLAARKASEGISIFDWEVDRLKKEAVKKEKKLTLERQFVLFPESGLPVVANWLWVVENCPFLEEGKCSIYGKRPLMCRQFPVRGKNVFFSIKRREKLGLAISSLCARAQETNAPRYFRGANETIRRFSKAFGECFLAKIRYDADWLFVTESARFLEMSGKIGFERAENLSPKRAWVKSRKFQRLSALLVEKGVFRNRRALERKLESNREILVSLFLQRKFGEIRNFKVIGFRDAGPARKTRRLPGKRTSLSARTFVP
ncbi:MAG: YkgJ family cysteine cluster protein [archaeon]